MKKLNNLLLAAVFAVCGTNLQAKVMDSSVATVNGRPVLASEYNDYLQIEETLKSNVAIIKTNSPANKFILYGIVLGLIVIAIPLSIFLGIRKAKQDKVY